MSSQTTTSPIAGVGTVFVPVSDQDRAIDFYVNKLGFELRTDTSYGEGYRWVEVAPPGAVTVVALVPPMEDGSGSAVGSDMGFGYDCDDFEAAYEQLVARGVEFEEPMRMEPPVPPMAYFRDQDGNRVLLVQRDA
jgi:catechol 2,3-dioxygenase-like lactoylglutathione lyase family enzyme